MTTIQVTTRGGETRSIDAPENVTLMEAIRDSGFHELLALCGGGCACATCHVHIDPSCADALPAMSADEDELLSSSNHRTECSRLSCQIRLVPGMPSLAVTIAPED